MPWKFSQVFWVSGFSYFRSWLKLGPFHRNFSLPPYLSCSQPTALPPRLVSLLASRFFHTSYYSLKLSCLFICLLLSPLPKCIYYMFSWDLVLIIYCYITNHPETQRGLKQCAFVVSQFLWVGMSGCGLAGFSASWFCTRLQSGVGPRSVVSSEHLTGDVSISKLT